MKLKLFKEGGQALIIIALSAIGLFGIAGLAIDGSAKFSDRRHAQNAADTAAMAAALVKVNGLTAGQTDSVCSTNSGWTNSSFCLDIIDAAWDRAEENGYDGLIPDSVDVYSPPISGPYTGSSSYVQVIITSYINTSFSRVLGINQTRNTVEAVALVREGRVLGDGAMLISYDPDPNCSTGGTGGYSVSVSGSSTVNLDGGGIFVNSDEVCGFTIPNCADLNIYGGSINSAGDNIDLGSCTFDPPITPNINQDPVSIPDDVDIPDEPPECGWSASAYQTGADEWHITPGHYTDFPQYSLNGDRIVGNKKHLIMDPGVYCVSGNIQWSGTTFDSLDGSSGVTIYIKKGYDFRININSPIILHASHSGSDYDGYLLIQDGSPTSIQSCEITGGAYLDINGMIFAPYCDITVNGGSDPTAEINAQLLGWDLKITGNNTINFNYNPDNAVHIKRRVGLMR